MPPHNSLVAAREVLRANSEAADPQLSELIDRTRRCLCSLAEEVVERFDERNDVDLFDGVTDSLPVGRSSRTAET